MAMPCAPFQALQMRPSPAASPSNALAGAHLQLRRERHVAKGQLRVSAGVYMKPRCVKMNRHLWAIAELGTTSHGLAKQRMDSTRSKPMPARS